MTYINMRFLIPKSKVTQNMSYYTYSDLNSNNIEVWFDRCNRDWVLPLENTKRPNPDNPISKSFTKDEFNNLFATGKKYPEEMISWKNIINGIT